LDSGTCHVNTGGNLTDRLHWLTPYAGGVRICWAPPVGEQVLLLSLGGELDTAFVLPASTSLTTRKVSTGTINCEHAFLRAVFNELKRLGE
jgi:phage baseplate assembly protein V